MDHQTLRAEYGVDPDGPNAYEAADRIEQLLRYRAPAYLERVSFRHTSAREFEFEEERRFAEQSEVWANERDLPQVARLAQRVTQHLEALARYSLRVAREVEDAVMIDVREAHDLRDWETRLQEGEFDPYEVIDAINRAADDNPGKATGQAHAYLDALYPFVVSVVSDALDRFNGQLAAALIARFNCPPEANWTHYRGFSACIWQAADEAGSTEGEPFFFDVIGAPEHAPRWSSPPLYTPEEALALLRTEVDTFWRQNPPVAPDKNNAP